jgi:L-fuconolactonase
VIDTHIHLWRRAEAKQSGILARPYLQRDFLWADYARAWGGERVERAVQVQVNDFTDPLWEAAFAAGMAESEPALGAYVTWAAVEQPYLDDELDDVEPLQLVRGVRRTCQFEKDPEFCASDAYIRGARRLGERELLCEICVRLEQIAALPRLVRACPETVFVLQHIGKPDLRRPPEPVWLQALEELGALPNVHGKLSVVVHSDTDPRYEAEALAPFLRHVVECLGWRRVMYGSNWPVADAVVGFPEWAGMLRGILAELPGANLDAVFAENARRLYRL